MQLLSPSRGQAEMHTADSDLPLSLSPLVLNAHINAFGHINKSKHWTSWTAVLTCTAGHLQGSSYIYQSSKGGDSCDPADVKPQESSWDLLNARPCWNPRAQVQTTTETSLLLCCPRWHQRDSCGRAVAQASKLRLVHRQMQNRNSHCTEGSRQPHIKRIQQWQKEHFFTSVQHLSVLQAEPLATTEILHY